MTRLVRCLALGCAAALVGCRGEPAAPAHDAPEHAASGVAATSPAAPVPAPPSPAPAPAPEPPPVAEDFEAEAEASIRADNYAAELDALERELDSDTPR